MRVERTGLTWGRIASRIAVPLVLAVVIGGCASTDKGAGGAYSSQQDADAASELAVDRAPTAKTLYSMAKILADPRVKKCSRIVTLGYNRSCNLTTDRFVGCPGNIFAFQNLY